MKSSLLCLSLALVVSPTFGQMPPPLFPVNDVTKLANLRNRTIDKDTLQKNLNPEKTPSGMTIYQKSPTKPIPKTDSESTSGADWPFTVSTGELGCKRLGDLHLVTLTVNGVTYALNGTARSRIKEYGWRDGDEIWKRDPQHPDMRVGSSIINKGISLCGPQPPISTKPASTPDHPPEPSKPVTESSVQYGSSRGGGRGCGSRGGPGYRLPSGKCASWKD